MKKKKTEEKTEVVAPVVETAIVKFKNITVKVTVKDNEAEMEVIQMPFEQFPYTNFHELNLDWLINEVKDVKANIDITTESAERAEAAAETATNSAAEATAALAQIDSIVNRKIIFIGDSYAVGSWLATGQKPWPHLVASKMKLIENSSYWVFAHGGESFGDPSDGQRFSDRLQEAIDTLTADQRTSITDIVIGGGYNEHNDNTGDTVTGMTTFYTLATTYFPNAKVHLFPLGWTPAGAIRLTLAQDVYPRYAKFCGNNNWLYYPKAYYSMQNLNRFHTDFIHPNYNGELALACAVFNGLNGGDNFNDEELNVANLVINGTTVGTIWNEGNEVVINFNGNSFVPSDVALTNSLKNIGTVDTTQTPYLFGTVNIPQLHVLCLVNNSSYHTLEFAFLRSGTSILLFARYIDGTSSLNANYLYLVKGMYRIPNYHAQLLIANMPASHWRPSYAPQASKAGFVVA